MRELKRIDPFSTAKIAGVIYLIITAVILIPFSLIMMFFMTSGSFGLSGNESIFGGTMLLFLPIAYAVIGYLATLLSCAIYNLVASWVGGIKYEVKDSI